MSKIKVLAVDDSAVMRNFLKMELSRLPDIEIIGTAPDAYIARDKLLSLAPDVIVLDVQMPKIDGLTFLDKIMRHYPLPVIIFSSYTKNGVSVALEALEAGAVDFVQKPVSLKDKEDTINMLAQKIREAKKAKILKSSNTAKDRKIRDLKSHITATDKIIAIGASTGGTVAIKEILTKLPKDTPPVLIAQHMPPAFTKTFAERLNTECAVTVKEAENGERLEIGKALIAPGDYHMELVRGSKNFFVKLNQKAPVNNQRPSVEVLFKSVAKVAGSDSIGIILTGMGCDGATGLLEIKKAGGFTVAQSKETSVIFGMPKHAIKIGAAVEVAHLNEIPNILISKLNGSIGRAVGL